MVVSLNLSENSANYNVPVGVITQLNKAHIHLATYRLGILYHG